MLVRLLKVDFEDGFPRGPTCICMQQLFGHLQGQCSESRVGDSFINKIFEFGLYYSFDIKFGQIMMLD
jgi:hypothetical protein